jgi:hypothetical protein
MHEMDMTSVDSAHPCPHSLISHPLTLSQERKAREELEREDGEIGKRKRDGVKQRQQDQPIIKLKSISISIPNHG